MSDDDSTTSTDAAPPTEVQNEKPGRHKPRHKPPNREASDYVPSDKEVIDLIARIGADRILALLDPGQTEKVEGPKKLSHVLESIDPEDAEVLIEALTESAHDLRPIHSLHPELAEAIQKNSADRRKPISHSVQVAQRWLSERHGNATKVE